MNTDQLIAALAQGAGRAAPHAAARRLGPSLAFGLLLAALLAGVVVGPLPLSAYATPTPWIKLLPVALLAGLGWQWLQRSTRPLSHTAPARRHLAGLWLVLALLGLATLLQAPTGSRWAEVLGGSWWLCPLSLTALALPTLVLAVRAARGLPAGQATQAGAALGLLSGCAAAAGYALACPVTSPAFVALWYSCGLLLSTALGAWLGAKWLRW